MEETRWPRLHHSRFRERCCEQNPGVWHRRRTPSAWTKSAVVHGWCVQVCTKTLHPTVYYQSTTRKVNSCLCLCHLLGKTQCIYEELFQSISNKCEELGFNLDPDTITLDFEVAVMNSLRTVFGEHTKLHGCFYHITQNTWKKVQELGLAQKYKESIDTRLFCGMIDALAFLPCDKVKEGMECLQDLCPDELHEFLHYFSTTYVSDTFRALRVPGAIGNSQAPVRWRRVPPLFKP